MPKTLIAGNWKMNGLQQALRESEQLKAQCRDGLGVDVLLCPPATLLKSMSDQLRDSIIQTGGQDCHDKVSGAHTGDISAEMLADAGASYVIVGHSERRADHGETDQIVQNKAAAAQRASLRPIVCVGETKQQREAGLALEIVRGQLSGSLPKGDYVVAYEPVWAIGTGLVPTIEDIQQMHDMIRAETGPEIQILYGGSVKPGNAGEILSVENVNGALVGGASLKAEDFYGIISAIL
ncbi:MAG: triose-phosphate isomerase [bacterium]